MDAYWIRKFLPDISGQFMTNSADWDRHMSSIFFTFLLF